MDMAGFKLRRQLVGPPVAGSPRRTEHERLVHAWQIAKRIMLMCLLAGAFMLYYVLDKMNQSLIVL